MANFWAEKGWNITLLTYDDGHITPAFGLHRSVEHRPLNITGRSATLSEAVWRNLTRLRTLRRAIRESRPEIVVSFLDVINVRTILATRRLGTPVIVTEHTDPVRRSLKAVWSALRRWTYSCAACVVTLTPEALAYFPAYIRKKGRVIPNPVPAPLVVANDPVEKRPKRLIGMGRLVHVKGFDQYLQAFARVAPRYPEWSVVIWGEGELRNELERLRDELGLEQRVAFPGWTAQPFREMMRASLFVLSSRYEGFSMVLCEAMACGLPVVSFDCPSGPRHIIRQGVDGILVPPNDVELLSSAMERLMSDRVERMRLGGRAVDVLGRFSEEEVMSLWEDAILDALQSRVGRRSIV